MTKAERATTKAQAIGYVRDALADLHEARRYAKFGVHTGIDLAAASAECVLEELITTEAEDDAAAQGKEQP